MQFIRKISVIITKTFIALVLIAMMAISLTGVSLVYDFCPPRPFSGPDIFDPYRDIDTSYSWKRANFHTHTRVEGIFNECEMWPGEVYAALERFGYDIVTFSNHNSLTEHPFDKELQVDVYEHGYNLFKYHKLVFGSKDVMGFDHLLPLFCFQKQFQLDLLSNDSDIIQLNHPLRTEGMSRETMEKLSGYHIVELDSGKSTENEYWDWALSAGNYSFALAGDDLHYPDRSGRIAVRCSFLSSPSARYEDIKETLLKGSYYSMRIPDYGAGDWDVKYAENTRIPFIKSIGCSKDEIFMEVSENADSIKVIGQDHSTLLSVEDCSEIRYLMKKGDSYARITAYFKDGEVIYTNAFARYDSSAADSPFRTERPSVNIPFTILFNICLLALTAGLFILLLKILRR